MFVYSMLIILAHNKGETNWNCIPVLYVCMDILYYYLVVVVLAVV